jgi:hypothetical protein
MPELTNHVDGSLIDWTKILALIPWSPGPYSIVIQHEGVPGAGVTGRILERELKFDVILHKSDGSRSLLGVYTSVVERDVLYTARRVTG